MGGRESEAIKSIFLLVGRDRESWWRSLLHNSPLRGFIFTPADYQPPPRLGTSNPNERLRV